MIETEITEKGQSVQDSTEPILETVEESTKPKRVVKPKDTESKPVGVGKATKLADINRYVGDVAVYELSRVITKGKDKYKYLVLADSPAVNGKNVQNIWASDERGVIQDLKPLKSAKGGSLAELLLELGFKIS